MSRGKPSGDRGVVAVQAGASAAQRQTAVLEGTVQDSTGAALPEDDMFAGLR